MNTCLSKKLGWLLALSLTACAPLLKLGYTATTIPVKSDLAGRQLAFCAQPIGSTKTDVFLMGVTAEPINATKDYAAVKDPALEGSNSALNYIDDAGCTLEQTNRNLGPQRFGMTWSPNGQQLVTVSAYTQDPLGTYLAGIAVDDEGHPSSPKIWGKGDSPVGHFYGVDWSTDGTIAVTADMQYDILDPYRNIFVGKPGISDLQRLTKIQEKKYGTVPVWSPSVWSPNGEWIAFHFTAVGAGAVRKDSTALMLVNQENTSQLRVGGGTTDYRQWSRPSWLPDSHSFVFIGLASSCACFSLFQVNTDGSGLKQLREHVVSAEVSPAGDRIAATLVTSNSISLALLDLSGSLIRSVVVWPKVNNLGKQVSLSEYDWTQDGKRLAFASNIQGDFDIYSVDADGNNLIDLTGWKGNEASPKWRPHS